MNRWAEYRFKTGRVAKNRVVVPPMASQTADEEGFVTENTVSHYKRLSKSGAGIVFVEYSHIHQSGKGEHNQLGVHSDKQIEGLTMVSSVIKSSGALSGLQIVHVGGKSDSVLTGSPLIGASSIAVPLKSSALETPVEATMLQIDELIHWYVASARRAVLSGFDILELHAAHGYGLNQWLSPVTNQRADVYGGDITGRFLIIKKIVKEIKEKFPAILLAVRLPAQDHFQGGLTHEDMVWVVRALESLGVDLLDVSSGIGGWRRPKGKRGQGYLVEDAKILKDNVSIPVIGVGGIKDGDFIDSLLVDEKVDFAAVGRAILEDPVSWGRENLFKSAENEKITM